MKAPAFQFYAAEYLADANVQMMSLEQEGAYIRLLAYCWREGAIPNDDEMLSRLTKGASTTVLRVVKERFKQHPTNPTLLIHTRLEGERDKQRIWREKSREGGIASGEARRNGSRVVEGWLPNGSNQKPTLQSSSSSSSSKEEGVAPPPTFQSVDDGYITELKQTPAYRHLDVAAEANRARTKYSATYPGKDLTKSYLLSWLNKLDPPRPEDAAKAKVADRQKQAFTEAEQRAKELGELVKRFPDSIPDIVKLPKMERVLVESQLTIEQRNTVAKAA